MHLQPIYIPVETALEGPIQVMSLLSLDGSLLVQMGLFLVLMAVLNRLLFRPTLQAVTLREERTTGARQEADRVRAEAEAKVVEFDRRLKEARGQASAGRKALSDEGALRRQELVDVARREASDLLEGSRKELEEAAVLARGGVAAAADSLAGQIVARLLGKAAVITLIVGASADAWASAGPPKTVGEFLTGALFAAINLAILVFLFVKMGRKGTGEFLTARRDEITRELAEAKRLREEAVAMLDEYAGKLDGLEGERAQLLEQFSAEGQTEKQRLVDEGQASAERLRQETRRTIERDIARVRLELRGEVLDRALEQATQRLGAEVGAAEQDGLVDDFLGRVRQMDTEAAAN